MGKHLLVCTLALSAAQLTNFFLYALILSVVSNAICFLINI